MAGTQTVPGTVPWEGKPDVSHSLREGELCHRFWMMRLCCLCFKGMRKGLSDFTTPEATAIELLGVWLCRVENCRLDGRVSEDQY